MLGLILTVMGVDALVNAYITLLYIKVVAPRTLVSHLYSIQIVALVRNIITDNNYGSLLEKSHDR